ncbi:MAG: aromatic amino acid DMT transporter YddG [Coriobacteriales bacterium]
MRISATAMGAAAILLWSLMVGLMRLTTEAFGAQLGPALVYAVGAAMLFAVHRPTPLGQLPRSFLLGCGALFVLYEVFLSLAVGLSAGGTQTIQVSMLNYLWPTLTMLVWALMSGPGRVTHLLKALPGALLAAAGMVLTVGGDSIPAGVPLLGGVGADPLPYALALGAAVIWAVYSNLASRSAGSSNATAYFFLGVAELLFAIYFAAGAPAPPRPLGLSGILPLLLCAASMAAGYALWNRAAAMGDMGRISVVSYFAPVLSSAMSSLLLQTLPCPAFWAGVALVAAGSVLGWLLVGRKQGKQA